MNRLKEIIIACAGTAVTFIVATTAINFGNRIDDVDNKVESAVAGIDSKVENIVSFLSTTTTSTSTTSTTTTTTTTPPKPAGSAKSSLAAKIDEWSPGTSSQVSTAALQAGGKMACNMWEAGPTSRMSVMREVAQVMGLTPSQLNIAALVAQAVLYTGCRGYANFPEGPLPFDCMGNGKICD